MGCSRGIFGGLGNGSFIWIILIIWLFFVICEN
ncbi:UNVERIFIED_CONTAM: hypothetical protein ABID98_000334 [Brevibacillus sp. OAP136]